MIVKSEAKYYAVRVGPFKDYKEAVKAKEEARLLYGLSAQVFRRNYRFPERALRSKKTGIGRTCFHKENFFKLYSTDPLKGKRYLFNWKRRFPEAPYPSYLSALIDFKNGRYEKAFKKAKFANSLGMNSSEVLTLMGLSLLKEKNLKGALTYFRQAFEREKNFRNFVNYVNILLETGNVSLAGKLINAYAQKYSGEPLYARLRKALTEAEGNVKKEAGRNPQGTRLHNQQAH